MGTRFGKYEVDALLGRGGMAEVFKARLGGIGGFEKVVALKRIRPSRVTEPGFVAMLLDEARLAANLTHPNIVQVFEVGLVDGIPFIAMEYVRGPSLRQLMRVARERGRFEREHVVWLLSQVCQALDYAHRACSPDGQPLGIVHRDVCPQNIMVTAEGAAKLLDFGIAHGEGRLTDSDVGTIKGKVSFMAPEQILGETLGPQTDVYAVGACLYTAITGDSPVHATNALAALKALLEEPPPDPRDLDPDCPEALARLVRSALTRDPRGRCPSARALGSGLESYLRGVGYRFSAMAVARWIEELFPNREFERPAPVPADLSALPTTAPATHTDALGGAQGVVASPPPPSAPRAAAVRWGVVASLLAVALAGTWGLVHISPGPKPPGAGGPHASDPTTDLAREAAKGDERRIVEGPSLGSSMAPSEQRPPARVDDLDGPRPAQGVAGERSPGLARKPVASALPQRAPTATGAVFVACAPACAITLDGKPAGRGPGEVSGVAPGVHELTVTAEGHEAQTLQVEVVAGAATTIRVRLAAAERAGAATASTAKKGRGATSRSTTSSSKLTSRGRAGHARPAAAGHPRDERAASKRIPAPKLPVEAEARSRTAVATLLRAAELQAVRRGGAPAAVARGTTSGLRTKLYAALDDNPSVTVYPRGTYYVIVRGARAGKSRAAINKRLVSLHASKRLRGYR